MEFFKRVTRFPFMATRRWWFGVSALLIAISLGSLLTRGLNLGIDFTGGTVIEAAFPASVDLDRVRSALRGAGFGEALVQNFGSTRDVLIRMPPEERAGGQQVGDRIERALEEVDAAVELKRVEVIGPQVGKELAEKGALAMMFTLLLILGYVMFRFEWKLAVGAVLAALHDPLIIAGFFSLSGLTFDLTVVAAMLAVIGYSLNDTVVVFDRTRECFRSMRSAPPESVLDAAINQTLSRTVITSGATLVVVIVLFSFGGEALRAFSTALIIGILIGTYSSIYIASAVALELDLTARDLMPPKRSAEVDDLP